MSEANGEYPPLSGSVPEWARRAARRITSGTKHEGRIDYHGQDAIGQWRWLQRTTEDVARIIAHEAQNSAICVKTQSKDHSEIREIVKSMEGVK